MKDDTKTAVVAVSDLYLSKYRFSKTIQYNIMITTVAANTAVRTQSGWGRHTSHVTWWAMVHMAGLVLARGGSKGIPLKNLAPLGSKPLLSWCLQSMLEFGNSKLAWYHHAVLTSECWHDMLRWCWRVDNGRKVWLCVGVHRPRWYCRVCGYVRGQGVQKRGRECCWHCHQHQRSAGVPGATPGGGHSRTYPGEFIA